MVRNNKVIILWAAILSMSSPLLASTSTQPADYKNNAFAMQTPTTTSQNALFLLLGTGWSFSRQANISVDPAIWDPAIQGYNARLGNSVLYTAGVGYQFTQLINADIEVTRRPSYYYSQFQVPPAGASTPGFLGTKTREFNFDNTAIMANVVLNGQGANLFANLGCNLILQPFVGAGIGVSYNTVSNFHSVLATSSSPGTNNVNSIMSSQTKTSFAWQVLLGAELLRASTWAVDLGYRYFDGGSFKSNNYFISVPAGLVNDITVSPWKGKLTANEVFLNFKYFVI